MSDNNRICLIAVALLLTSLGRSAAQETVNVDSLVREVDELYRSTSSHSVIEMEIVTPHWQRTLSMECWTEGTKKTFIRISAPKKEQGVATLRVGNEMWNYLPKTNKVIKVPPSMMMSSWMGSDFTNDDLVKEFSLFEDYRYELISVEDGRDDLFYINCIPREGLPVVWGNVVTAVRKTDHLPVWQKYYDEKGAMIRVLEYRNVKEFCDRQLPAELEMVSHNKTGHKTIIRYLDLECDIELEKDLFSLRNLRSRQ